MTFGCNCDGGRRPRVFRWHRIDRGRRRPHDAFSAGQRTKCHAGHGSRLKRRPTTRQGSRSRWSRPVERPPAAAACPRAPARLAPRPVARLRPVATSQATGLCGDPSRRHRPAAIANASWAASSLRSVSSRKPTSDARTWPHSRRKTSSRQCAVSSGTSTSGRTSTAPPSRTAGIRCATSSASSRSDASNTK